MLAMLHAGVKRSEKRREIVREFYGFAYVVVLSRCSAMNVLII